MDKFDARRAALDLVTAYVNNNSFKAQDLPALLSDVYEAISGFDEEQKVATSKSKSSTSKSVKVDAAPEVAKAPAAENNASKAVPTPKAAVSVKESLRDPNFIVSMITGEKMKTLKRHLRFHGLDEGQYRERYNLPQDYPMVAPAYSILRRKVAKQMGLGRVGKATTDKSAAGTEASPKPAAAKTRAKSRVAAAPKKAETAAAAAPKKGRAKKAATKSAQPSAATAPPAATPVKKASDKVAPSKAGPAKKKAKPATKAAKPKVSTPSKADTKASGATVKSAAAVPPANAADAPKAAEAMPAPASGDTPRQKLKPVFNA